MCSSISSFTQLKIIGSNTSPHRKRAMLSSTEACADLQGGESKELLDQHRMEGLRCSISNSPTKLVRTEEASSTRLRTTFFQQFSFKAAKTQPDRMEIIIYSRAPGQCYHCHHKSYVSSKDTFSSEELKVYLLSLSWLWVLDSIKGGSELDGRHAEVFLWIKCSVPDQAFPVRQTLTTPDKWKN